MRRLIATFAMLATAATLSFTLFGCSHKLSGVPLGNQPPHTYLFVQGPVDSVDRIVKLSWYGTDADGYVVGYEIKLVNPEDPVAADSAWQLVPKDTTSRMFHIYTPQGHARPTFYVRAIDNLGARDPHPAVETFLFKNPPPVQTLMFLPSHADLSDTTYAALTVYWEVRDTLSDMTRDSVLVWLDGNSSHPDIVWAGYMIKAGIARGSYTIPSDRFLVDGRWTSGPRTVYVQAVDDGGRLANAPSSATWYVRAPVPDPNYASGRRPGRLLIVDDDRLANTPGNFTSGNWMDTLYTNTAIRNLPSGSWSVINTASIVPFKTAQDLEQTLKLYDSVIWYRGMRDTVSTLLQKFQPAIQDYVDSGGNVYLEGLAMIQGVNATGALTTDFVKNYLDCTGITGLQSNYRGTVYDDSTAGWGCSNNSEFLGSMDDNGVVHYDGVTFTDSLKLQQVSGTGIRVFNVGQNSEIAMVARRDLKGIGGLPGLTPMAPDSLAGPLLPVAVSVAPTGGRGRVMLYSFPIAASTLANRTGIPRVLAKIFAQLGLTGL